MTNNHFERELINNDIEYIASRIIRTINGLHRDNLPQGDIALELSLIVNALTGKSGRIWRSARDILIIVMKLGGKARFRDFQTQLPYTDSTISRALTKQLLRHGILVKEGTYWILNAHQIPFFTWLISMIT